MDDVANQSDNFHSSHGVTDVYVTLVHKDKIPAFRAWLKHMHQLQAEFPGFQKVYVQVPKEHSENCWVTLLQFDTEKNLEYWLHSSQRSAMLNESKELIKSQQAHRLFSSFGSWFSDVDLPYAPPIWKQAMLVLLALFPAVMLETIYLFPHMNAFNPVMARFIGVILIVCSFSWVLLPVTNYFFQRWLSNHSTMKNILGVLTVIAFYLFEIGLFMLLD